MANPRDIRGTPEHTAKVARITSWRLRPENAARIKGYIARYKEKYRVKKLVWSAIKRCQKTGIACDKPYLLGLIQHKPELCECCGNAIDYTVDTIVRHVPKWRSPSLDRVDTSKGYIPNNVRIICWRCNALKRDGSLLELEKILAYMRRHLER